MAYICQLIHADKHGFLAIPQDDEEQLAEAAGFLCRQECETVIAASKSTAGLGAKEILARLYEASRVYAARVNERFGSIGE